MAHLAEYVALIYLQSNLDAISITHVETYEQYSTEQVHEQIIHISQQTKIYTFSDGTQLKQTIEQDNQLFEVEACLESWIEYQIIHNSNPSIQPQKIHFDNHCRELHWIKYFNQV